LTNKGGGRYSSLPGLVTLALIDVKGNTTFDCANSSVLDISGGQAVAIPVNCSAKSFGFTVVKGKTYEVRVVFIQQPSPFDAVANLVETPCNQKLLQIDDTTPSVVLRVTA